MQLELAWRLVRMDAGGAHTVLSELRTDIVDLIARVRRIGDGRGIATQVKNLESALRYLIRQANRVVAPRLELSLTFDPRASSIPGEIRSAAFWIVLEAVINVLKHSTARRGTVALSLRDGQLHVCVEDDGQVAARSFSGGSGLANMAARAAEVGGWCSAGPQQPTGFRVTARFPLPPRWD
jgi:signal transduction histidine kinase